MALARSPSRAVAAILGEHGDEVLAGTQGSGRIDSPVVHMNIKRK